MSLTLSQSYTAINPGNTSSFLASGGTSPYVYSVIGGGAGGTIDSSLGTYTAPTAIDTTKPSQLYDTIQVTDSASGIVTANIFIGNALLLFCDIIQTTLGLDNNHIFLWDQKIFQPTDSGLYIIVSVESCKPFGNVTENATGGSGINAVQYVNMYNVLGLDIISRSSAARDQKEFVIAALNSPYAEKQMEKCAFFIGKITTNFHNLSAIDGAAIPYRFHASVGFQYTTTITTPISYYNSFQTTTVDINP